MEVKGDKEQERIIDDLEKWFEDNEKLPNKINRILLTRFYYCMHKDVEETKKLLEMNYTLRQSYPELFENRDPADEDTKNSAAYADAIHLPGLSPDNYKVSILRLNDPDPKLMHHAKDIKAYIMVTDNRFSMPDVVMDNTSLLSLGEIKIIDMENHTLKHLTRLSISVHRTYMRYLHQAYPVRIKAIHMINCPSFLDTLLGFLKPFISKQVYDLIHFHTNGLESLYDYVPRDMLPEEYGGTNGKISDFKEPALKLLQENRDYLMDPDYWKV